MDDEERDAMLIEMHTDLKYLRKDFENPISLQPPIGFQNPPDYIGYTRGCNSVF
jgi:hypothetical protein